MEKKPKYIVFDPDTSYTSLIWDDEGAAVGEYDYFFLGDEEYSLSPIKGLKEWYLQIDKYDPYTDIAQFSTEGMEEWINQGYELAKQLLDIIPQDVGLYYGYWHQFGDGKWRHCKAYISRKYYGTENGRASFY